jgi:hypothetical protein
MASTKWSSWAPYSSTLQVSQKYEFTDLSAKDGFMHCLFALTEESNPDQNHVHVKMNERDNSWVLCSIKVDGMRVINRRLLIERINKITGLSLSYK